MSFTSGLYASHARAVLTEQDEFEKKNTVLAYNYKVNEFVGFCHSLFPSTSNADNPATVNEEKVFGYLCYTSRRSVRNRGMKQRTAGQGQSSSSVLAAGAFDRTEYDRIMDASYEAPANLVGYDVLNQTYSGILRLWKRQCDLGANNATKDQLRSQRVLTLMNIVKKRKKRMARRSYQEKVKSNLSPYLMVSKIPLIEEWLWKHNAASSTFSLTSMRDRFVFLLSTHAILRGESMFLSDLSDYCDLVIENGEGCSECQVLVLQVDTGKTNGLKTLYGRVLRHKNAQLCPIGALGFMLLGRFEYTKEIETFYNLLENKSWFGVKALIDYRKNDLTTAVSDQSYAKAIKACCKNLDINSQHFVHIGRSVGPIIAEIAEVDGDAIANLGNWNVSVREDRYSAKLPMQIMRVMAGHSAQKNVFYLPRSEVKPSDTLQRRIFPFIEALELELSLSPASHPTASAFLTLLKRLRAVILQDAAVLLDQGRKHSLFCMDVFTTPEFMEFKTRLVATIHESRADPASVTVQTVLPGICERLDNMQSRSIHNANVIRQDLQIIGNNVNELALKSASKDDLGDYLSQFAKHIGQFRCSPSTDTNNGLSLSPAEPSSLLGVATLTPGAGPYKLKSHKSITGMWEEWYGLRSRPSERTHETRGGIHALEATFKSKWRMHFTPAEAKQFSRMKYIVNSVAMAVNDSETEEEVLEKYESLFEICKSSLFTMEKVLKGHTHWNTR